MNYPLIVFSASGVESGIYSIRCLANGKLYVGSAVNLKRRIANHRSDLKRGKHANIHLQRCHDLYGEGSLLYEVIERIKDVSELIVREQYYIDHYEANKPEFGLNILPNARSRAGVPASEETKKKLKEAWKRRRITFPITDETRAKLSASSKGHKVPETARAALALWNAKRAEQGDSPETTIKRKEAWARRKLSPNYKDTLAKTRVSAETIAKIVHLYKEGFTSIQIGPIVGISSSNVRILLKRNGVLLRTKGTQSRIK